MKYSVISGLPRTKVGDASRSGSVDGASEVVGLGKMKNFSAGIVDMMGSSVPSKNRKKGEEGEFYQNLMIDFKPPHFDFSMDLSGSISLERKSTNTLGAAQGGSTFLVP